MFYKILVLISLIFTISSCENRLHRRTSSQVNKVVTIDFKNMLLPKASKAVLDEQIVVLKKEPKTNVELSGYCGLDASKRFNLDIATKRAEAVRSYLLKNGISSTRIKVAIGYNGKDLQFAGKCIVTITKN